MRHPWGRNPGLGVFPNVITHIPTSRDLVTLSRNHAVCLGLESEYESYSGARDAGVGHQWGTESGLGYVRKGYALRRVVESAIGERDGSSSCFYCGGGATHLDHVTAKFHGGSDSIENLVLACRECNFDKNTQPGWFYVTKRMWTFRWPDPFVKPTPQWNLAGINRPCIVEFESSREV